VGAASDGRLAGGARPRRLAGLRGSGRPGRAAGRRLRLVTGAGLDGRAVRHPARQRARLAAALLRSHQILIGGTGTGKTTLVLPLTMLLPRLMSPE
jgi:hypothetical protein